MKLDNTEIVAGDTVFDLEYGVGTVKEVAEHIHVYHSANARYKSYDARGMRAGAKVRTLYWQNPVIASPPKDKARWDMVVAIAQAAVNTVGGINEHE